MSSGKQTYIRYHIIDRCFSSPGQKYFTIEEILEKLADHDITVTKRTIENDFKSMREDSQLGFYAPIAYCWINKGHYYTDPDYSINKLPITQDQVKLLEIASHILQQFKGMNFFSEMEEIVDKLGNTVKDLRKGDKKESYPFIHFEEAAFQEGLQHMAPLIKAINEEQPVTIQYNPFGKELKEHNFHPYFLKQYKQRWYLIGRPDNKKLIFPLALDRMKNVTYFHSVYKANPISNPEEFFKNIIGISYAQAPAENIILSFSPQQGNYIKTQYLHKSQKILVDNEKELRIALKIVPNYEFISLLMGFTPDVEVIEPQSVRDKVKTLFEKGLERYGL